MFRRQGAAAAAGPAEGVTALPQQATLPQAQQARPQQASQASARPVMSSVPLEMLLYFGSWYMALWWVVEVLVFLYKGTYLPYPDNAWGMELSFVFLFVLVEPWRVLLCSKGNKTLTKMPAIFALLLALPTLALEVYLMLGQTYVLKIEEAMCAGALLFGGLQVLLGAVAMLSYES